MFDIFFILAYNAPEKTGTVKKLINETFYLDYLVMSNLLEQNQVRMSNRAENSKKEIEDLTNKLIEKIIMLNPEMAEKQLNKLIAEKYAVIKKRDGFSLKPLQEKYKQDLCCQHTDPSSLKTSF